VGTACEILPVMGKPIFPSEVSFTPSDARLAFGVCAVAA